VLNSIREDEGASKLQHRDFLRRVVDELDDLPRVESFHPPRQRDPIDIYELTEKQMLLVGMRESKIVRRKVVDWLEHLSTRVHILE